MGLRIVFQHRVNVGLIECTVVWYNLKLTKVQAGLLLIEGVVQKAKKLVHLCIVSTSCLAYIIYGVETK